MRTGHLITLANTFYLSGADAFGDDDWCVSLRRFIVANFSPISVDVGACLLAGFCFGHQMIATAFGLPVGRSGNGWEIGHTTFDILNDSLRETAGKSKLQLCSFHQDAIVADAETVKRAGFTVTLTNCYSFNQGMLSKNGRIVTFQPHPEFSQAYIRDLAAVRFGTTSDCDICVHVESTCGLPIDSHAVASWIGALLDRVRK